MSADTTWRKLGQVYVAGGEHDWAASHAFVPTALDLGDRIRVYAAFRDARRRRARGLGGRRPRGPADGAGGVGATGARHRRARDVRRQRRDAAERVRARRRAADVLRGLAARDARALLPVHGRRGEPRRRRDLRSGVARAGAGSKRRGAADPDRHVRPSWPGRLAGLVRRGRLVGAARRPRRPGLRASLPRVR